VQYLAGDFELREVDLFRGMMGAHCASLNGWDETEICEEGEGTGEHSTGRGWLLYRALLYGMEDRDGGCGMGCERVSREAAFEDSCISVSSNRSTVQSLAMPLLRYSRF
jgi:hypothetical protein